MNYANPIPGTNKFELLFRHGAGVQHTVALEVELFKA